MLSLRNRDLVCQQAIELLTDYLEGSLSRRQRLRLEAPLARLPELLELPRADPTHRQAYRHHRTGGAGAGCR